MALYVITSVSGSMLISADGLTSIVAGTAGTAIYYLLEDHYINNMILSIGSTVTEGIDVPISWVPTPNVDPLNQSAVQAFYNAGPQLPEPIRAKFSQQLVHAPITYWREGGPNLWSLTGLGANLPPVTVLNVGRS